MRCGKRFDDRFVIVADVDAMLPSSAIVDVAMKLSEALKPIVKRGGP
jgi:hypothetical protein